MTCLFQPCLLGQPFGDPVLYVRLSGEKKALLIDLGESGSLPPGSLLKVQDVFISHTHIDHFIGFDHLLRLNLARNKILRVFGPPGIIKNVRGKLAGYAWNLVSEYQFVIEAVEIGARELKRVRFACAQKFKGGPAEQGPRDGLRVDSHPHYGVSALRLEHGGIASLAYLLEERFHINIKADSLQRMGLPVGPWLRDLKTALWEDRPDDFMIQVGDDRLLPVGRLRRDIATVTRGRKIAYVSDCRGTAANLKKIISFVRGADLLYCEAAFLDRDRDRALERGHLTARQAGMTAREAGAGDLEIFHFSPRYETAPELLYQEAQQAFRG